MNQRFMFALLLGACTSAHSADSLPPMMVTQTGYPIPAATALNSIEIIDRDTIEQSSGADIADLLRFYSGLEIGRNGGPGQAASLFIRGTESDHNLILIDGVAMQSGSVGNTALQHIDPMGIERIEIVKGPQSTLWGSGAIGGVINIITRTRAAEGKDLSASIEAGGDQTRKAAASLSLDEGPWQLASTLSVNRSDGFPTRTDSELDRGYRNTGFSISSSLDLSAGKFTASRWQSRGNVEYLGFLLEPLDQDFLNSRSSVGWNRRFSDLWKSELLLSQVRDEIDQTQSSQKVHTDRMSMEWRNLINVLKHQQLLLGVLGTTEQVDAVAGFAPYKENTDSVEIYTQFDLDLGRHHLLAGLRHLDHEDAGEHWTWSLNYGYRFNSTTRLTASASTGFRYPSANERFGFGGNPDLRPEQSQSYEVGIRYRPAIGQHLQASLYRNDIDDLIDFVIVSPPFTGFNQNAGRARIDGIELNYDLQIGPWTALASASWQDPENRDSNTRLLRRAENNQSLQLHYYADRWSFGARVLHAGPRKDFGNQELDSYTVVNIDADYRLGPGWELYAKVDNLFDEDYELASGFRTQKRIGFIGIRMER